MISNEQLMIQKEELFERLREIQSQKRMIDLFTGEKDRNSALDIE